MGGGCNPVPYNTMRCCDQGVFTQGCPRLGTSGHPSSADPRGRLLQLPGTSATVERGGGGGSGRHAPLRAAVEVLCTDKCGHELAQSVTHLGGERPGKAKQA